MKVVKLKDLLSEIRGKKNISNRKIWRVIRAFTKVVMTMLLAKKEVSFPAFFKLGFRVAKDRLTKSNVTQEILHMPQHLRFKATFYNEFKRFINKKKGD